MVKNLFGQYKYKNSLVHRLDARLKLLYLLSLSALIFLINDAIKIVIFSFFIGIIILLSKIRFNELIKGLKPFFFIFVFILVMYLTFSRNKLEQGLIAIWRFLMLIIISFNLTFTTTTSNLISAVQSLLKPLKFFNIKPRNIATMISIAIRFVPVMFLNLERLKEAMTARLANFRKFKHMKLIIVALLERMFKSASNLSDAMQARLYNEDIEIHKTLKLSKLDFISLLFISVFIFVLIIY